MHLIPGGITPFSQRYISQYIFSLAALGYNSYITPYRSIPAFQIQACGRETRCYVHRIPQPQTGDRNRSIPHQDSMQPWPIKCTQTLPSLAKHAADRATPLSGVRKTCTRTPRLSHFGGTSVVLLLLINSGFRKTYNIKGHRRSQLKRTLVVVVVWLSRRSQTDVPRFRASGGVP